MKKLAIFLTAVVFLSGVWSLPTQAEELSLNQLVELFISLGIIPSEKADAARSALASSGSSSTSTGGGSCRTVLITRTLGVGSSGEDVRKLQLFLIEFPAWYPNGEATGYYGALTEKAVQRFQAAKGIVSSGTAASTGYGAVGARTRAALSACGSSSSGTTTNTASSTITFPTKDAEIVLDQKSSIRVQPLFDANNTATQFRYYISGGTFKNWTLFGTTQRNDTPISESFEYTPNSIKGVQAGVGYAISVMIDKWDKSKYVAKETIYLPYPIFFKNAIPDPKIVGSNSGLLVPARGSLYRLDKSLPVTVRLKADGTNSATRARFYVQGGVTGKNWVLLGTQETLFRPESFTINVNPATVTTKVGTTTVSALSLGNPYTIAVSIDEWKVDKYVLKETLYLGNPLYFTTEIEHTVNVSPIAALASDDIRYEAYQDIAKTVIPGTKIAADSFDMNDDGTAEVFTYAGGDNCTAGCSLSLYRKIGSGQNAGWQSFFFGTNKFASVRDAIMVLPTKNSGFKDIAVIAADGYYDVWRYDGQAYKLTHRISSLLPGQATITANASGQNPASNTGTTTAPPPPPPPPPAI